MVAPPSSLSVSWPLLQPRVGDVSAIGECAGREVAAQSVCAGLMTFGVADWSSSYKRRPRIWCGSLQIRRDWNAAQSACQRMASNILLPRMALQALHWDRVFRASPSRKESSGRVRVSGCPSNLRACCYAWSLPSRWTVPPLPCRHLVQGWRRHKVEDVRFIQRRSFSEPCTHRGQGPTRHRRWVAWIFPHLAGVIFLVQGSNKVEGRGW